LSSTSNPQRPGRRRPITAEDLLRFHIVQDPQVSPAGDQVVFVKKHAGEKNEYVRNVWAVEVQGGEPRQFTAGGKDGSPRWSPDGRRVAFVSQREEAASQVYTIAASGGEARKLTAFPEGSLRGLKRSPDGLRLAVLFRKQDPARTEAARKQREEAGLSPPPRVIDDWWYRVDGEGYFHAQRYELYLVDSSSGEHERVFARDKLGYFSFDFSPDSSELAIAANLDPKALIRPWKDEVFRIDIRRRRLRRVPDLPPGPKERVTWSPDGSLLAYAGRMGKDSTYSPENLEIFVCDPIRGKARSLTANEDYCLLAQVIGDLREARAATSFCWAPDSKRVFVNLGWHGETHVAAVPARGGPLRFLTSGRWQHEVGNLDAGGRTFALTVSSAVTPAEVCAGELRDGRLSVRRLTDFNGPLLRELELARPSRHWVRSSGGARVQVWCLRPLGRRRLRRGPAVLEVHGGPHAQYGETFFHEFQLLAAEGFTVFYSNPRGSKGYGRDFCAAIRGRWGGVDWEDLQAVTEFIQTRPFVDPKRLGIAGGSYGGYMTNWAISHSRDYAAAVTDRCVSNLVSMFGTSDYPTEPDRYWRGNSWDRPEEMWAQSPLRYFGAVRTPTLIIHSEGDLRCSIEQAEQIFTVLKLRGVPVRFVRYPASTSHGMSRDGPPDLRLHRLREIVSWMKKHLAR
jgi:dipeptidyl aminopeptidase/acylaminoacyl peptidase